MPKLSFYHMRIAKRILFNDSTGSLNVTSDFGPTSFSLSLSWFNLRGRRYSSTFSVMRLGFPRPGGWR